jgi:hypothetical protein
MRERKSKRRKAEGIYTTHEEENLLFVRAMVNGVLSAAYVKDGKLVSYEPWDAINRQMYSGPYLVFNTADPALDQPKAC